MRKTATLPPVRVEKELRETAERLLEEGETLSSFVEKAFRARVEHQKAQKEFIERALAARDRANKNNSYIDADIVHARVQKIIQDAKDKY